MDPSFIAGKPVTGNNLIGRDKEVSLIMNHMENGQSIVLTGPRRFGKTSIILEVLNQLKNRDMFTGYIDFFTITDRRILAEEIARGVLSNKKLDSFFNNLKEKLSNILRNVEFKQTIEDFEFILDFRDSSSNDLELLKKSFGFIDQFASKYNRNIVMAFDEFADVRKLDGMEIIKLFRSIIQLQDNACYIFSGSHQAMMDEVFVNKSSPFYRFARIIRVGFIQPSIFEEFLSKRFREIDISISNQAIEKILQLTKGHPYYTQLIAQTISISDEDHIDENNIQTFIDETLWNERSYFENIWNELSYSKEIMQVLLCLAKGISPYRELDPRVVNISRAMNKLDRKGFIIKYDGKWQFTDPMLRYWIVKYIIKKR